ncbi:hypothetical protein [Streptomyces cyaneofuscatus]|uniref:hypothetical protein n=1 Tax=Streptomyces cyaneofuscatus TaxID=66883 RepID=UPI00365AB31D
MTSSLTPITIGFPPFTVTREKATPPSAAPAGTAAIAVSTTTAPPATAALLTVFPIPWNPALSPCSQDRRASAHRPEADPHG